MPGASLAPFVSTYYFTEVRAAKGAMAVEDYLHPEWANIRFIEPEMGEAAIGPGALAPTPPFCVTGPTSMATRFSLKSGRSWGIGLMPLGWAKFTNCDADRFADKFVDGHAHSEFAAFAPLADVLAQSSGDFDSELAIIEDHMARLLQCPIDEFEIIASLNKAMVDSSIDSVSLLASRAGLTVRSLERLSRRAFGFSPKLLLRRQRFLRSLAQFMLDPTLKWLSMIDYQYHDQAHFVRDFRRFMGMTPSAYGKLDHPFLRAAARARAEIAGEAVQGLHPPSRAS